MPPGVSTLAGWLLPLRLRDFRPGDYAAGSCSVVSSFGIGLGKLSHTTLQTRLDDMIAGGDPLFIIELVGDVMRAGQGDRSGSSGPYTTLCRFATRPSLIKAALQSHESATTSIMHPGPLPAVFTRLIRNRQRGGILRTAIRWGRWLALPIAFTVFSWAVYVRVDVLDAIPRGLLLAPHGNLTETLHTLLPPVPERLSQAFGLGGLLQRLQVRRTCVFMCCATRAYRHANERLSWQSLSPLSPLPFFTINAICAMFFFPFNSTFDAAFPISTAAAPSHSCPSL